MPAISNDRLLEKRINQEIIDSSYPAYTYTYLISSSDLMSTTNPYIAEAQKANRFNFNLILDEPNPEKDKMPQLHIDVVRGVKVNNQNLSKLSEDELKAHIQKTFGDNAPHLLAHYSQVLSYFITNPLSVYFPDIDVLRIKPGESREENIFNHAGVAIRMIEQPYFYFQVAEDSNFMLPDKRKLVDAERENLSRKDSIREEWSGCWRFKADIKILSRASKEGFEILAIGTDSALVACMYLDKKNPNAIVLNIVETILDMEHAILAQLTKVMEKAQKAEAPKKAAIESKVVSLEKVIEKINSFKLGNLSYESFVKQLDSAHRIAVSIQNTGPVSAPLNAGLGLFGFKVSSSSAKLINRYVNKFKDISDEMENALITYQRLHTEQTSKDIDFTQTLFDAKSLFDKYHKHGQEEIFSHAWNNLFSSENWMQASKYTPILDKAETSLGLAIVLSAILNDKNATITKMLTELFNVPDVELLKKELLGVIKNSTPSNAIYNTAIQVIESLTKKFASKETYIFYADEIKSIEALEANQIAHIKPLRP